MGRNSTCGRVRLKPDGTRWRTGGEVKGKLANGVGSQYSHTTSERGVSSFTNADAHISAASSRLIWRPRRFKRTRPFRRKTKYGFCECAVTFQTHYKFLLSALTNSKFTSPNTAISGFIYCSRHVQRHMFRLIQTSSPECIKTKGCKYEILSQFTASDISILYIIYSIHIVMFFVLTLPIFWLYYILWDRGGAVCCVTALQVERSRVRLPMVSLT